MTINMVMPVQWRSATKVCWKLKILIIASPIQILARRHVYFLEDVSDFLTQISQPFNHLNLESHYNQGIKEVLKQTKKDTTLFPWRKVYC